MITTPERYRRSLKKQAAQLGTTLDIEAWTKANLQRMRELGMLVTEQQYQDHRNVRKLREGDRARYIGPDRVEPLDGGTYTRPHGQEGTVTLVKQGVVTWQPDATAADTRVVELRVRCDTPGYYTLERIQ